MTAAAIISLGSYLPPKIVTNDDIAKSLETSDEWIRRNTGITKRHIAAEEGTTDMAIKAGRIALSGIDPSSIDGIIVATSTPDETMPACAAKVQAALGTKCGMAFDLQCACSGFLYGATVANSLIMSGQNRRILLIGADTMSKILDWNDRKTCVLFGDGAGACVLSATNSNNRIINANLYTDGFLAPILRTYDGVSSSGICGTLKMNGPAVFKHAIEKMHAAVITTLERNGLTINDIDWVVPHQANIRIANGLAERMELSLEKLVVTIEEHANTSAASIPLALHTHMSRFKPGDLMVIVAVGSGLSWGAMLVRWGETCKHESI